MNLCYFESITEVDIIVIINASLFYFVSAVYSSDVNKTKFLRPSSK